jgi:hypothetical protein
MPTFCVLTDMHALNAIMLDVNSSARPARAQPWNL